MPVEAGMIPWFTGPVFVLWRDAGKACGQASDNLLFVYGIFFQVFHQDFVQ